VGQLHLPINISKRQYLDPHRFKDGSKLLEFGASGSGTMMALAVLLASSNGRGGGDLPGNDPIVGSWAGDSIVIAGEYGDEGQFISVADADVFRETHGTGMPTLYHLACALYEDISDKVIRALCEDPYERKALIGRGAKAAVEYDPLNEENAFAPV
jgi:hypothetical protein